MVGIFDGYFKFIVPRDRLTSTSARLFGLWITVPAFVVVIISLIFLKNQTRPITNLARAAEKFGKGEEIDLSGVYSFNTQFSIIGKYNYSFSNSRRGTEDLIDTMIGMEYDSCCYSLKIVARDYWTGTKKDNALCIEFLPKGLTTTNNKTSALLRRGISGYEDRTDYE